MKKLLGPMLYAEDQRSADLWTFSVTLYLAGTDASRPPPLRLRFFDAGANELAGAASKEATVAADFSSLKGRAAGVLWKWSVALPRGTEAQRVAYRFEPLEGAALPEGMDDVKDVVVPARGALPRAAFFSCNGASDAKTWTTVMRMKRPFGCWEEMRAQHEDPKGGFHLLLGGGDQVYADSLWDHEPLVGFRKLTLEHKLVCELPPGFHEELAARFVDLYCERWGGSSGIAPMLARVPGLFTWDDHDIFDGWGSHQALQACPWYEAVYSAAALAFEAFQLGGLRTDDKTPRQRKPGATHYLQTLRFPGAGCNLDVVALDLRSGRTSRVRPGGKVEHTVMSDAQWAALDAWRHEHASRAEAGKKPRHAVVMSSIPLVHMRYGPSLEGAVGRAELEIHDDMLDQWESVVHRGERTRLIVDLFTLARQSCCSVTVVSGDVHLGARGRIRSRNPEHIPEGLSEAAIEQVTSSAIVHPPPGALQFLGMLMLSREGVEDLPSFLETEMLPVGGGRYLRERNWLSLRVEPASSSTSRPKLWLGWEAEHTPLSTQVVVDPPPVRKG